MTTISQPGLAAAIRELRAELTAMSSWVVNYNSQISDTQAQSSVTKVITAYLNAAQPPKTIVAPPPKGK